MQKWELFIKIEKNVKGLSGNDYEIQKLKALILYPIQSIPNEVWKRGGVHNLHNPSKWELY